MMRAMPDNSIDAVVTDPPYGITFMGREWDTLVGEIDEEEELNATAQYGREMEAWHIQWLTECYRVLKPNGRIYAFSASRTYHRLASAMEKSGFSIADTVYWTYGSGFPKSLDVSKAIDKRRFDTNEILEVTGWIREMRDEACITNADIDRELGYTGMASHWTSLNSQPAVPTLEQVPELLWVLRVDENDIPERIRTLLYELNGRKGQPGEAWFNRAVTGVYESAAAGASWRVNNGMVADLTAGERRDKASTPEAQQWEGWGTQLKPSHEPIVVGIKGDPSHFTAFPILYCAKPTRAERNAGLVDDENSNRPNANFHPTVKPIDLMRQLVELSTERGDLVLDPFLGSGTTAVAATLEKRRWVGCEMTEDYWAIIEARTEWADAEILNAHPTLFEL